MLETIYNYLGGFRKEIAILSSHELYVITPAE